MTTAAVVMIAIGLAMAAVWTRDILSSPEIDRAAGLFWAREQGTDALFWLHWLAEYGTAAALVTAGIALLAEAGWARVLAFVALGSLLYTSVSSLGWALGRPERLPYAVPMVAGLLAALVSLVLLSTT